MFKGHPKGLIIASIANMGERFGFYTMMAILVLFLQSKFGLNGNEASVIYSTFYFFIYALALVGGIIADRVLGLNKTILIGIVLMLIGYTVMASPITNLYIVLGGLLVISFGNGLFKGNLQALVGNLYDHPKYQPLRDRAFSIFYMCINVGAIFAPFAAVGIRNWWLGQHNFNYHGSLPEMCHLFNNGKMTDVTEFQRMANEASVGGNVTDLKAFATQYLDVFNSGYHYAFAIAAGSMVISMLVYVLCKKYLKPEEIVVSDDSSEKEQVVVEMSKPEEKKRLVALGLVFLIVIFFWMSFHQNGMTLTFFAKDYTVNHVDAFTGLFFNISSLMGIFAAIGGLVLVATGKGINGRALGVILAGVGIYAVKHYYDQFSAAGGVAISAELFQGFNPMFVVALTPLVVAFFGFLNKRGKEPSAPRKIGIGMIIAAASFVIMAVGSMGLTAHVDLAGKPSPDQVSAYLLISTYFSLTIAELFLSPMGISFVSKVAPPKYKGLMQGGWLCATALGNQLLFVGSLLYYSLTDVWMVWAFFVVCCIISATIIFSLMKKLEAVAK